MKHLLVTGAAGFIGSNFTELALKNNYKVTIIDALTYAGNKMNYEHLLKKGVCDFVHARIEDANVLKKLFTENNFSAVVHFAAESHVDNSISNPGEFLQTNIFGTFQLLQASLDFWKSKVESEKESFRFVHVSTDEVFGALGDTGKFSEDTPYAPNSPYSASKASSDHLARAWFHTYGLPTIITNCSNNYGPKQNPEKLIPKIITNALSGKKLPVYGQGLNIRDWIHVEDHCRGVLLALEKGISGEAYCFGGNSEKRNIDVVKIICKTLDRLVPSEKFGKYESLISFVEDRLGHDFRYAIDDKKALTQLGFKRKFLNFEQGIEDTVRWYLSNGKWINEISMKGKSI